MTTDFTRVHDLVAPPAVIEHVPVDEYVAVLDAVHSTKKAFRAARQKFLRFVNRYPTLSDWLAEPLEQRLGRLRNEPTTPSRMTNHDSYFARRYLVYASMSGRLQLPWDFLLATELRDTADMAAAAGHPEFGATLDLLVEEAVQRGWTRTNARQALHFALPRFAMRHADPTYLQRLSAADFETFRGEIKDFYATVPESCNTRWKVETRRLGRGSTSAAFAAHAICYQLGVVSAGPVQSRPQKKQVNPIVPTAVQTAFDRWREFDEARGTPLSTRRNHDLHLRYFGQFLEDTQPGIKDLAELSREHVVSYLGWLANRPTLKDPSKTITDTTRRQAISTLALVLRDLYENDLGPAPGHALIHRSDYPKLPTRLPRFIPRADMGPLQRAIAALDDPYQRSALLLARWSGARRDEIRRLELDCLDTYADGTYRLRIPAGKTRRERMVPLADEAAHAVQEIQARRAGDRDAPRADRITKAPVRYLFMMKGRLLSSTYLFDSPLLEVCKATGMVTEEGGRMVTAHRFRHTLGTDLAEKGARWRTIMSILGHESADMTMVYAHISDPEVKADYEKVVAAGAAIAGPAGMAMRAGTLKPAELDWLQSNFYKSEMELGGCVRLPAEGPCECDLFLKCQKFFTTEEHAPRLRRRWHREAELIDDAEARGWPREVERHRAIQQRLEELLAELGQPLEGPIEGREPSC